LAEYLATLKWFLIINNCEDASFAPTKAALHLCPPKHSPNVYEDNHGADADIMGVGRLIFIVQMGTPVLENLGQRVKF
jgi:hypothetical protein